MINKAALEQLLANPSKRAAVTLGGSMIVLCGGFFVMAWATTLILRSHVPRTERSNDSSMTSTKPTPGTTGSQPATSRDSAGRALQEFMSKIRDGQWEEAWRLTTSGHQARVTTGDFRSQMLKTNGLSGFRSYGFRSRGAPMGKVSAWDIHVELAGGAGENFILEMFDEDGGWKVDRFERQ